MFLSRDDAARLIGMKPSEVVDVQPAGGGAFDVTTHDRQVVRVGAGGTGTPVKPAPVRLVGEHGPEIVASAAGAVVAPTGGKPPVDEPPADGGLAKAIAGTKNDVAQWVGRDVDRARRAVGAEKARTDQPPRVTLIAELEKLIKDAGSS